MRKISKKAATKIYNEKVDKVVKEFETMDAETFLSLLESQHLYRNGGIGFEPLHKIIREIAEARVCDCGFIESWIRDEKIQEIMGV